MNGHINGCGSDGHLDPFEGVKPTIPAPASGHTWPDGDGVNDGHLGH